MKLFCNTEFHLAAHALWRCRAAGMCTVVHVHATKAYRGSEGTAPLILNLGTKCGWAISFIFQPLDLRYLLNRNGSGPQSCL